MTMKKYDESGMRLTDCCGAHSTYPIDAHGGLCCKKCYRTVEIGEGDGCEYLPSPDAPQGVAFSRKGE
jgi:hypothetical protein